MEYLAKDTSDCFVEVIIYSVRGTGRFAYPIEQLVKQMTTTTDNGRFFSTIR